MGFSEKEIFELLKTYDLTISTAESCTGGLVASRLVNVAGISEFFEEGFITYSDRAKHEILKVSEETLDQFGAVSSEIAAEMAYGAALVSGSDLAVSVTGYAGPDAGDDNGEVGLVYIGCYICGDTSVDRYVFDGDRQAVREQAAEAALEFLKFNINRFYNF